MSDDIRARITKRLEELGKSPRAVSLASGMSADAIRDMFRKSGSPTIDTLRKLAVGLETSAEWLAFGTDAVTFGWPPKQSGAPSEAQSPKAARAGGRIVQVPLVGPVEAGAWREAPQYAADEIEYVTASQDREFPWARHIAFRVVGDSMNDLKPVPILPGARIIGLDWHDIDSRMVLRNDLLVVVEQTRDAWRTREWTVKQLEIFEDRYVFHPRSTSGRHKPIEVPTKVFHDPSEDEERTVRLLALVRQIVNDATY